MNKFKSLAIISDCVHTYDHLGNPATENHIFCRQIQELASRFMRTIIVCPFIKFETQHVTSTYMLSSIEFIPVPQAGGNSVKDKLHIIKTFPAWFNAFARTNKQADIVYLRMPNNISIPGFFYFKFKKSFITYTGTWNNYTGEPFTYRFQKWLLKTLYRNPVWIYTADTQKQTHLLKGYSPSYSEAEWHEEKQQITARLQEYDYCKLTEPVFITVGALVPNKNQQYILDTCRQLRDAAFSFKWYIVGDGYMKESYAGFIQANGLQNQVILTGKKIYTALRQLYRDTNFLVQATIAEGFGKTPVEAMFHGVIPILSYTAMSTEMTGNGTRGFDFDVMDKNDLYKTIITAMQQQHAFKTMIENGRSYVRHQTLESWANDLVKEVNQRF